MNRERFIDKLKDLYYRDKNCLEELITAYDEKDKEIERLNEELKQAKEIALNEHKYASEMEDKYITANNIINELEEFKEEHKIMKQILIENNLWETLLNDDRFLEHLRK